MTTSNFRTQARGNKAVKSLLLAIAIFLSFFIASQTYASENKHQPYSSVRGIAELGAIKPGDNITIATEVTLAPHWHVYWRNPGDSGLPIAVNWKLPEGFEISEINWPVPDKISYDILVNYGFYDKAMLLQTLTVPDTLPEGKITLTAHIDTLICHDICVPESADIVINLNDPENLDTDNSELIKQAQTKLPTKINGHFSYENTNEELKFSFSPEDRTLLSTATVDNTEFFPYDLGILHYIAPTNVEIDGGKVNISYKLGDQPLNDDKLIKGLLVIKGNIGENIGYEIEAISSDAPTKPVAVNKANSTDAAQEASEPANDKPPKSAFSQWMNALSLALFGGIILNLMPCVFPVLSIKALSLVKMKDEDNSLARMHGLSYTLGVILSFIAIAAVLIILKEAGSAIGWGFQLQSPLVVGLLAYLLFTIGLNLIGFFEINLSFGGIGNSLTQKQSLSGSFFTGTLATIVATPCTAPFMGAAMGFALTQPTFVGISVFAMLGFGLALPYLLLSFIPQARIFLPKPGAWMNTFKQFLAFPMFASAIWLIWVLSKQAGTYGVFIALLGLLAIAFGVWLSRLKGRGIGKIIANIAMIATALLVVHSLSSLNSATNSQQTAQTHSFGSTYTKEALSSLLEQDEPVFVEMTAAWCITCKVNQAAVINTGFTKNLFKEERVQFLIGDWTNKNAEVTEYLNLFERDGVPLYVYYGERDPITGNRPEAKILPQILTTGALEKAIKK